MFLLDNPHTADAACRLLLSVFLALARPAAAALGTGRMLLKARAQEGKSTRHESKARDQGTRSSREARGAVETAHHACCTDTIPTGAVGSQFAVTQYRHLAFKQQAASKERLDSCSNASMSKQARAWSHLPLDSCRCVQPSNLLPILLHSSFFAHIKTI